MSQQFDHFDDFVDPAVWDDYAGYAPAVQQDAGHLLEQFDDSAASGTPVLQQQFTDLPVDYTLSAPPILRSVHTPPRTQADAGRQPQQSTNSLPPLTPLKAPILRSVHTPRSARPGVAHLDEHSPVLWNIIHSPGFSDNFKMKVLEQMGSDKLDSLYKKYNFGPGQALMTPDNTPEKNDELEFEPAGQTQDGQEVQYQGEHAVHQGLTSSDVETSSSPVFQDFTSSSLEDNSSPLQPPMGPLHQTAPLQSQAPAPAVYRPVSQYAEPIPDPFAPAPIYVAYTGHFTTSAQAKQYRKRTRIDPKSHATDIDRVRRHGRAYWVRRIYNSMIEISNIEDGPSSIHYKRFTSTPPAFTEMDLEATAHHIFDSALAVHARGWNRPVIYHKKVVRGKLTDLSERTVEGRLACICTILAQKKAVVDDAIRGGITLALLCDNPEARGFTKMSNNAGNKRRGEKLKLAKSLGISGESGSPEGAEEE